MSELRNDPYDVPAPPPKPAPTMMSYPPFGVSERRNIPWRWIIFGVVLSFATIAWFSHMILGGYHEATARVETLHNQMANQDWDGIYRDASWQYRSDRTAEENRELFAAICRKLGQPVSTKQENIYVNSNFSGTTVTATFETTFSLKAKAIEHLTWTSLDGQFRLTSYEITSMDLVLR